MQRIAMMAAVACLGISVSGYDASAGEAPAVVVKDIVRTTRNDSGQAIRLPAGRLELVASTYDIAPGARLPQHKHPFQRYAYVLQGDLKVEQVGRSSRIYRAGEMVVESVGFWHYGENVGSVPVRLLVIDQVPKGRATTVLRPLH